MAQAAPGAIFMHCLPAHRGEAVIERHLVAERRGRLSAGNRVEALRDLAELPITLDDETAGRAWRETMKLAGNPNLNLYDAAHLETALRRGLVLATLDKALREAADRAGVSVLTG